jgi:hypothetical protein
MLRKIFIDSTTGLLVLLFIYAAVSKLLNYKLFVFQLGKSPYLTGYSRLLSVLIPLSEMIIVVLLIFNRWRMLGLYASYLLMSLFTGYVYLILNYADHIPCSCGGIIAHLSWNQHLYFNIVVTALTMIAILVKILPYPETGSDHQII